MWKLHGLQICLITTILAVPPLCSVNIIYRENNPHFIHSPEFIISVAVVISAIALASLLGVCFKKRWALWLSLFLGFISMPIGLFTWCFLFLFDWNSFKTSSLVRTEEDLE
ncbi:MAG: hypothetical protein ACYTFY_05580 [Planctomycetota bacterium]